MKNKTKEKIIFSLYNSNIKDKSEILLKKQPSSKKLLSSYNTINESNSSYLKNLKINHSISIKKEKKLKYQTTIKINQSTNAINTKKIFKLKINNVTENCKNNNIDDINVATIHSNGKFRKNIRQKKDNIRKKIYEKNIILSNNFIKNTLNKNLSLKLFFNRKDSINNSYKYNWKCLNISSHYLGNTLDNKFGVITNKYCVNKNVILTSSHNNLNLK